MAISFPEGTMLLITTELLEQAADWIQLEFGRRPVLRRVKVNDEWHTEIVEDSFTPEDIATIRGLLIIFLRHIFKDTDNADVPPRSGLPPLSSMS